MMKPILDAIKAPFEFAATILVAAFWSAVYLAVFSLLYLFVCWGWHSGQIDNLRATFPVFALATWVVSCMIYAQSSDKSGMAYKMGLISFAGVIVIGKILCFVLLLFLSSKEQVLNLYVLGTLLMGFLALLAGMNVNATFGKNRVADVKRGTQELPFAEVQAHAEEVRTSRSKRVKQKIEILKMAPKGRAPVEVREKWVGLVFPLIATNEQPEEINGELVYTVNARTAFEILEEKDPDASDWYFENLPEYFEPGFQMNFGVEQCKLITDPVPKTNAIEADEEPAKMLPQVVQGEETIQEQRRQ